MMHLCTCILIYFIPLKLYNLLCMCRSNLGEIEVAHAWVDLLLNENRSVFKRINALDLKEILSSKSYLIANKSFLSCQTRNVSIS